MEARFGLEAGEREGKHTCPGLAFGCVWHVQGLGCSRTGRVYLASAASGSFQKATGARSTPGWLNSPRLSARSGEGDVLGTLQGRRQ